MNIRSRWIERDRELAFTAGLRGHLSASFNEVQTLDLITREYEATEEEAGIRFMLTEWCQPPPVTYRMHIAESGWVAA